MNKWTQHSIDLANNGRYLDQLFTVYSFQNNPSRDMDDAKWAQVEKAYEDKSNGNNELLKLLLGLDLFPLKYPLVSYLKKDPSAIERNPETVKRIVDQIRRLSLDELKFKCTAPIEANRQMGQLFNNWVRDNKSMDLEIYNNINEFRTASGNRCFVVSDAQKKIFVDTNYNYKLDKGIDFLAMCNHKLVIGEAKFITDFGGHQQTQFNDAVKLLSAGLDAVRVAILMVSYTLMVVITRCSNMLGIHLVTL